MAKFNEFEDEGGFGGEAGNFDGMDFGLRGANKLVPLPATQALQPFRSTGPVMRDTRYNVGQFAGATPAPGVPQGFGGFPGSASNSGSEQEKFNMAQFGQSLNNFLNTFQQGSGATVAPGMPSGYGFGGTPQATGGSVPQMIQQFRSDYPLGQYAFGNNAQADGEAIARFGQLINAAGGDYQGLLAEIGPTRMFDRMREFLGKGDTLDQSGIIQIGNGRTLLAPRYGDAANQVGSEGVHPAGGIIRSPSAGGGGGSGESSFSSTSGAGGPGYQRLLQLSGKGANTRQISKVADSLRSQLDIDKKNATASMQEYLAGRGITGGGIEAQEISDLHNELTTRMGQRLTEVSVTLGIEGARNQLSAAQAAAQAELQNAANAISKYQIDTTAGLARMNNATTMALGQGRLYLDNLALNSSFAQGMLGSRIDAGGLINAIQQAALGNNQDAINALIGIAQVINAGYN